MVPVSSMIMMAVVLAGCIIMPIVAFLIVRRKSKNITGAFFAGVLSFFAMQVVIRLPILMQFLPTQQWYLKFAENNFYLYIVIIAFSAALFETVGRIVTMKLLLKEKVSFYSGISHGIGHGGIEMIVIIGLTYVNNLIFSMQINAGTFDMLIETTKNLGQNSEVIAAQLLNVKELLISTPASDYSMALIERFFTLFIHIGLSVFIAEGIVRNKLWIYTGIALLIHTTVDTYGPMMVSAGVNHWIIEGTLGLVALGMLIYVLTSKKRFEKLGRIYPKEKEQEILDSDY